MDAVAKAALCDVRHRRDSRPSMLAGADMLGGARVAADLVCRRSLGKFSGPLSTTPYSSMARGKRESMPRSDFFLVRLLSLRPVSPRTTNQCVSNWSWSSPAAAPAPKHRPGTLSRLVAVRPPPVVRCPGYSSSPQSSKHCPEQQQPESDVLFHRRRRRQGVPAPSAGGRTVGRAGAGNESKTVRPPTSRKANIRNRILVNRSMATERLLAWSICCTSTSVPGDRAASNGR